MDFEYANSIKSLQEFVDFLVELNKDFEHCKDEWENPRLDMYLDSMLAWINAFYKEDEEISWSFVAKMLYAASRYE